MADHGSALALRHRLIQKWAPEGSLAAWDASVPLDEAAAWNSPTVWDVFAPTYGCSRPLHVGGVGSEKWSTAFPLESKVVCNAHLLREAASPCTVYSFGVGWDTTFESSVLRLAPGCKVRVFDPTTTPEKFWSMVEAQTPQGEAPPRQPSLSFHQVGLANRTTSDYSEGVLWNGKEKISVMTLPDIMAQQGDTKLTVLKVDIEGSEWPALHHAVEAGAMANVEQLLLEVHLRGCESGYSEHDRTKLSALMEALEGAGLRAFSQVPNLGPVAKGARPSCGEYSFVNTRGRFVTRGCGP